MVNKELKHNEIWGKGRNVYRMPDWEPQRWEREWEEKKRPKYNHWWEQPLSDINDGTEDRSILPVTGGLTSHLSTAMYFARFGWVLILDSDKIETDLIDIKYEAPFFLDYPEIYAHITASTGVIIYKGQIVATVYKKHNVHNEVYEMVGEYSEYDGKFPESPFRHSHEDESVALSLKVPLGGSIMSIVDYTDYSHLWGRGMDISPDDTQSKEKAIKEYYQSGLDSLERLSGGGDDLHRELSWYEDKFVVVLLSRTNLSKTNQFERIPKPWFDAVYTGDEFIYDYKDAYPYIGGR